MNVEQLQNSNKILYEVVAGSRSYGTHTPTSDWDLRGFYWVPTDDYICLPSKFPKDQISNEKNDITYYSLRRAFELLSTANPNMIELLWMPEDCIKIKKDPIMELIFKNRNLFISKKAYWTHAAYSIAQIGRAKGKNKKVHNPQPETMPQKEDFCRIIDMRDDRNIPLETLEEIMDRRIKGTAIYNLREEQFPFRPIPLKETSIDLSKCHVSSLEHSPYTFRLYNIGEAAKGVFRGDQMLCCESISKEEEINNFIGLLIYNKEEFDKALKDWHSYWDWKKNRNEARWIDQEKGVLDYDQKNMMHCVRLIMSSESILKNGEPIVRFVGNAREHLMDIRNGKFTYDEIMKEVEERKTQLDELFKASTIPEEADTTKINNLYRECMKIGEEMYNKIEI